jgi:hypothetical protein
MLAAVHELLVRVQDTFTVALGTSGGVVEHPGVVIDVLLDLANQYPDALEQGVGLVDVVLSTLDQ